MKIKEPAKKVARKRGRPVGSGKEKETIYVFEASDGCKLETSIRDISGYCSHKNAYAYKRTIKR